MLAGSIGNVSRETIERLKLYEQLVLKWTKKINLVSAGDAAHIWDRHIVDSMQLYALASPGHGWLDLGSGGGFPGLVAAIMAQQDDPERKFTLVDSDQRKCTFLRTVVRELSLNVTVLPERIEDVIPQSAPVLSARALGDLRSLLGHVEMHMAAGGMALLPKGVTWEKEHEAASKYWSYDLQVIKSETNPDSSILIIKELTRA